jgi:hypothetical protein
MAIIPAIKYPGQTTPADADYPYGSARNVTEPGDDTGTPFEKALVDDTLGFQQALLTEAGISPSGTPDKVGASQYSQALKKVTIANYSSLQSALTDPVISQQAEGSSLHVTAFATASDNGAAIWIKSSATGTPSQSPIETGAATFTDASGGVWNLASEATFNALGAVGDGVTDDTSAIALGVNINRRINGVSGASYNVTTVTMLDVNAGSEGSVYIDFNGATLAGTGRFLVDSSKRITMRNFDGPGHSLELVSCWYSEFHQTRCKELVFGGTSTNFSASYWNNFYGGIVGRIRFAEGGTGPNNSNSFYGLTIRSDTGQGLTETYPYCLEFDGNVNAQAIQFFGGDISYATDGVYRIAPTNTQDVELSFYGVYFDSKLPTPVARDSFVLRVESCHYANIQAMLNPYSAASVGPERAHRGDRSVNHTPASTENLIPYGDFTTIPHDLELLVTSTSNATFTPTVGGPRGMLLEIDAQAGKTVFFRTNPTPAAGVGTGSLMIRSKAGQGTQPLKFGFGLAQTPRYKSADVTEDWAVYSLTDPKQAGEGSTGHLQISEQNGNPYIIELGWVSLSLGAFSGLSPSLNARASQQTRATAPAINLAPGATTSFDLNVNGALSRNDFVQFSSTVGTWANLMVEAKVVDPGVVRVWVLNPSTVSTVTIASGNVDIAVTEQFLK